MNNHFSFFDDVGSEYHFFSWLNAIERCMTPSSIENLKWGHLQALLIARNTPLSADVFIQVISDASIKTVEPEPRTINLI
jgi:hypothetical protein